MLRAIGVMLLLAASAPGATADWPMFQGDNLNSGRAATIDAEAQVWWTWSTPGGRHIEAAPVAGEGVVVVTDWSGAVTALDSGSGKPLWTYDMRDKIVSTPAIALGWVYVADIKGDLVALDLRDGRVMAEAKVGATRAPITINEGKLFMGNEQGEMQAFTATTLDLLWSFSVADAGETFQFNNATGVYQCLVAGRHPARPIRTAAAVHAGSVLFGSMNHYVYAVDESGEPDGTTTLQWRHQTQDIVLASPVVEPGALRVYFASYDETVRSLSMQPSGASGNPCFGTDLSPHWTFDVPGPIDASKVHSTPAFDGDHLYFGTNGGAVYAIDAGSGDEAWRVQTGGPVLADPIVANGTVVVGSDDGIVRWIDAGDGAILTSFQADAPVKTGAAALDGTVVVASEDGTVYRLGSDPPARPDLAVGDFTLEGRLVSITVHNEGKAASEPTVVQVWDNGTLSQTHDLPAIEAGGSHAVVQLLIGKTGTIILEAIIDPDQALLEAGRENNKGSDSVFLAPEPEPDDATGAAPEAGGLSGMAWAWLLVVGGVVTAGGAGGVLWWRRRQAGKPLALEREAEGEPDDLGGDAGDAADGAGLDDAGDPGAHEAGPDSDGDDGDVSDGGWLDVADGPNGDARADEGGAGEDRGRKDQSGSVDDWDDDWDPSLDWDGD